MCLLMYLNSAITCESLGSFANGVITYRTDRTSPFDSGTTATYSCYEGYYLEGEDVRTCVEDVSGVNGIWSGSTPRCAGKYLRYLLVIYLHQKMYVLVFETKS